MAIVGYYDLTPGAGLDARIDEIEDAGHVPMQISDITAEGLAGIDTLYALNASNTHYALEWRDGQQALADAVSGGMNLVFFDRKVTNAAVALPGLDSLVITRDFGRNVQIAADAPDHFISGPGGEIDDTTFDNGNSSWHGYVRTDDLPEGAVPFLTTGMPDQVIAFSYEFGAGSVFYSTIPLDLYSRTFFIDISPEDVSLLVANVLGYLGAEPVDDGDTLLTGTDAAETLFTGNGNDQVTALGGDDRIFTRGGNDTILGGDGADVIRAGSGDDSIDGGDGADSLIGAQGNDTLHGGDGNDTLEGGQGDDSLHGGLGDDVIQARFGNDTVDAGDGNDTVNSDKGDAFIDGGAGDDRIFDGLGDDTVSGGAGDDWIYGVLGADSLMGDDGNDTLRAGDGDATIEGGAGNDLLIVSAFSTGSFHGGAGFDTLSFFRMGYSVGVTVSLINPLGNGGVASEIDIDGVENLTGTRRDDTLTGDLGANRLLGNGDDDRLFGLGGADILSGGNGDDSLQGGNGDDRLFGRDGDDRLYGGNSADVLYGGSGNDTLIGGQGADRLFGGDGWDVVDYSYSTGAITLSMATPADNAGAAAGDILGNIEELIGTAFDDRITGNLHDTILRGYLGDDTLVGRDGADSLFGGSGSDQIDGGAGDDVLAGNAGADRFVFGAGDGADTIRDFGAGADIIALDSTLWSGALSAQQVVDSYATAQGNSVVFAFEDGEEIVLRNYLAGHDLADLSLAIDIV